MKLDRYVSIAFEALTLNKLRSLLTMLGIIIGVASVIAMIGLGQGSQAQITSQVQGMGSAAITLTPGSPKIRGFRGGGGAAQTLTLADARALEFVPGVVSVTPSNTLRTVLKRGRTSVGGSAVGAGHAIAEARGLKVSQGRFFNEQEARTGAHVVVLSAKLVDELFAGSALDPMDAKIRIGKQRFRVIGILAEQGGGFMGGGEDQAYIPIRAFQASMKSGDKVQQVIIKAEREGLLAGIEARSREVLRQRHGLTADEDDDFRFQTPAELLETVNNITGVFTALLAGTAAISLLVGGIGIMNIMLVSVTERTREIGLRKAMGAKRRDILIQFLLESAAISVAGGTAGIVFGLVISWLFTQVVGLPFVFSPAAVFGAFAFSAAVGIFFGLYPANKASVLDPVEALRYE